MKGLLILVMCCVIAGAVPTNGSNGDQEPACQKPEKFKGCTLKSGECVCDKVVGCKNPWPFKDEVECEKELNGKNDKCLLKEPCVHGQCVQVNLEGKRKWQCACAGTGYYGRRCEEKCPSSDVLPLPEDYPAACIY